MAVKKATGPSRKAFSIGRSETKYLFHNFTIQVIDPNGDLNDPKNFRVIEVETKTPLAYGFAMREYKLATVRQYEAGNRDGIE